MNRDRDDQNKSSKPPETKKDKRWQAGRSFSGIPGGGRRLQPGRSSSASTEEAGCNNFGGKTFVMTRKVQAGKQMMVHSYEKIYKDHQGSPRKSETYDRNLKLLNVWSQTGWTDAMRLCIGSEQMLHESKFYVDLMLASFL
ncbi:hypothetical protein R1sor_001042 [Riccia sorocarpa]|uniref:Uncharacterized protein n=1 Tax=Riccia sorocarpa TaxID=122646 RepID=A0ABD3GY29_9MARC